MRASLRVEGIPRPEPAGRMSLSMMAGFLAIVALPIPFLAVTGLSVPLPSAVASIASGLVPGASDPSAAQANADAPMQPARRITPTVKEQAQQTAAATRAAQPVHTAHAVVVRAKPHAAPKPHPTAVVHA